MTTKAKKYQQAQSKIYKSRNPERRYFRKADKSYTVPQLALWPDPRQNTDRSFKI